MARALDLLLIMDITVLKDFLDLGGTFILALVLLYMGGSKLDKIDSQLAKLITLVSMVVNSSGHKDKLNKVLDDKELKDVSSLLK